ncbi:MAG: glycoside hydrolase family 76 protein [Marinoscillum sp.]
MKNRMILLKFILILLPLMGCKEESNLDPDENEPKQPVPPSWISRADSSFNSLNLIYWNAEKGVYNTDNKKNLNTQHYWWQANALDAVVDAAVRAKSPSTINQMNEMISGIKNNISSLRNNDFFDDREWMALSILRAYELTENEEYLNDVKGLWEDIKLGWNDNHGGGIAWNENQLDYKNAPSNGPAAILAFRLHKITGSAADLDFGKQILAWQESKLVDPVTGIVWDGIGRQGGTEIDGDNSTEDFWRFTYNQGTYAGALAELYTITKDRQLLVKALKTFSATESLLSSSAGIIRPEGDGDGGLFKGIMMRYFGVLALSEGLSDGERRNVIDYLVDNGESAWDKAKNPAYPFLFNHDWRVSPPINGQGQVSSSVDLTVALSGVFLMETLAVLENEGLLKTL